MGRTLPLGLAMVRINIRTNPGPEIALRAEDQLETRCRRQSILSRPQATFAHYCSGQGSCSSSSISDLPSALASPLFDSLWTRGLPLYLSPPPRSISSPFRLFTSPQEPRGGLLFYLLFVVASSSVSFGRSHDALLIGPPTILSVLSRPIRVYIYAMSTATAYAELTSCLYLDNPSPNLGLLEIATGAPDNNN